MDLKTINHCKDSERREQCKIKKGFFLFCIAEPHPIFDRRSKINRRQYKKNLFFFIVEVQPIFDRRSKINRRQYKRIYSFHLPQVLKILIFNASCLTTILLSHTSFWVFLRTPWRFFASSNVYRTASKNVFLLFSEAKRFLIFSPFQLVCALLLRGNKKGRKNYKNIFSVDEKIKNASVSQKRMKKYQINWFIVTFILWNLNYSFLLLRCSLSFYSTSSSWKEFRSVVV